jgi:hypothetical protein
MANEESYIAKNEAHCNNLDKKIKKQIFLIL